MAEELTGPYQDAAFMAGKPQVPPDDVAEMTGVPIEAEFLTVKEVSGMTFLKLDDCPSTYDDQGKKWVRVHEDEAELKFDHIAMKDIRGLIEILRAYEVILEITRKYCRLGDRDVLASDWTSASLADKNYLYLCNETTGKFSNGDEGKNFEGSSLKSTDGPTFDHLHLTQSQGVTGLQATDGPTFVHVHVPVTEFTFEEGTWTPVDTSGAGLVLTISGTPRYARMGNWFIATAWITYPVTADVSTNLIGGLPFTIENNLSVTGGGTLGYHSLLVGSALRGMPGSANVQVRKTSTDNAYTNAELSAKSLAFSISCRIA